MFEGLMAAPVSVLWMRKRVTLCGHASRCSARSHRPLWLTGLCTQLGRPLSTRAPASSHLMPTQVHTCATRSSGARSGSPYRSKWHSVHHDLWRRSHGLWTQSQLIAAMKYLAAGQYLVPVPCLIKTDGKQQCTARHADAALSRPDVPKGRLPNYPFELLIAKCLILGPAKP
jgi:hypothetical protein